MTIVFIFLFFQITLNFTLKTTFIFVCWCLKIVFRENNDFDIDAALAVNTVHEFDKTVVVPIHKYNNVEHYYQQGSSARQAHAIRVPFLSVAAADDPLIPLSVRPVERCASQTMYVSTERGGHVAHLMNGKSMTMFFDVLWIV